MKPLTQNSQLNNIIKNKASKLRPITSDVINRINPRDKKDENTVKHIQFGANLSTPKEGMMPVLKERSISKNNEKKKNQRNPDRFDLNFPKLNSDSKDKSSNIKS